MRERPGSAVGFAGGLDFHTERGSGDPRRLDERLHPEDGDHPLQIVRQNVKAHLRSDLFKRAQAETPCVRSSPSTKRFIKNPDSLHQDSNPTNVFSQPAPGAEL